LKIPLLPKNPQSPLVVSLDGLSEEAQGLARLHERKHAAPAALKKSLLHQAFTGEL
jgi:type I restriction enzyme S subunit